MDEVRRGLCTASDESHLWCGSSHDFPFEGGHIAVNLLKMADPGADDAETRPTSRFTDACSPFQPTCDHLHLRACRFPSSTPSRRRHRRTEATRYSRHAEHRRQQRHHRDDPAIRRGVGTPVLRIHLAIISRARTTARSPSSGRSRRAFRADSPARRTAARSDHRDRVRRTSDAATIIPELPPPGAENVTGCNTALQTQNHADKIPDNGDDQYRQHADRSQAVAPGSRARLPHECRQTARASPRISR